MTFLYLVPTGMNDVTDPTRGSWAGRYGPNEQFPGRHYFWANERDEWRGSTSRENTLARWAEHLQNDFRARLDWCVKPYAAANHPPVVRLAGDGSFSIPSGGRVMLDTNGSKDPDGDGIRFDWVWYPEAGTYRGALPVIELNPSGNRGGFDAPKVDHACTLHLVLVATDTGSPPLTRYRRMVITVEPPLPEP
jgi:hypothetical protein